MYFFNRLNLDSYRYQSGFQLNKAMNAPLDITCKHFDIIYTQYHMTYRQYDMTYRQYDMAYTDSMI